MRTMLLTAAVLAMTVACSREAPGTGDTTQRVTVPGEGAESVTAPAAATEANPSTLQLVTAGVPQPYLADQAGRALYYLEGDTDGSKCTGDCTSAWPPFLADEAMPVASANLSAAIGVVDRADGRRQVTYNQHPLYRYAGDAGSNTAAGNGVRDQWGQWHAIGASGDALPMPAPK